MYQNVSKRWGRLLGSQHFAYPPRIPAESSQTCYGASVDELYRRHPPAVVMAWKKWSNWNQYYDYGSWRSNWPGKGKGGGKGKSKKARRYLVCEACSNWDWHSNSKLLCWKCDHPYPINQGEKGSSEELQESEATTMRCLQAYLAKQPTGHSQLGVLSAKISEMLEAKPDDAPTPHLDAREARTAAIARSTAAHNALRKAEVRSAALAKKLGQANAQVTKVENEISEHSAVLELARKENDAAHLVLQSTPAAAPSLEAHPVPEVSSKKGPGTWEVMLTFIRALSDGEGARTQAEFDVENKDSAFQELADKAREATKELAEYKVRQQQQAEAEALKESQEAKARAAATEAQSATAAAAQLQHDGYEEGEEDLDMPATDQQGSQGGSQKGNGGAKGGGARHTPYGKQ